MIVPSRGPAARLARLLDSLAEQTVEHEAIVVDNASPRAARSTALCERHRVRDGARRSTATAASRRRSTLAPSARRATCSSRSTTTAAATPASSSAIAAALDPRRRRRDGGGRAPRQAARPDLIDTAGLQLDRDAARLRLPERRAARARSPPRRRPDRALRRRRRLRPRRVPGASAASTRRLFAYWEDTDLALRLIREGHRCRLAPDARGTHEHSATLGAGSAEKNRLTGFGRGYVLRKWGVVTPRRAAPGARPRARRCSRVRR